MTTQSPQLIEHPTMALSSLSLHQPLTATRLTHRHELQVLRFLAERPLDNVIMAGFISDNGVESKLNRGTFYGCLDAAGALVGVALIGHAIFVDVRCDEALRQFAQLARKSPRAHMLMGERELIERFWEYYAPNGQPKHRVCREILFELSNDSVRTEHVANLRLARVSDLSHVVPVHAEMAFAESGVDPLKGDEDGFQQRCLRRIEAGRTWLVVENDQLIFKTDIISDTPEVVYLEGVYVHPHHRGTGHGSRCLAQLTRKLLAQTKSITVLVNAERRQAQRFFCKLGFVPRGWYDTCFLQSQAQSL